MPPDACPACRSRDSSEPVERWVDPVTTKEYRLCRCPDCAVVFSEPRTAADPEWYSRARMGEDATPKDDWRHRVFFLENAPPADLLDVGCGAGQFLEKARAAGFRVHGFDFHAGHVRDARARGVEVQVSDADSFFRQRRAAYDIVTLFDVIEHVPEPAGLLAGVRDAMRPGARLVVTTQNARRPLLSPRNREQWDYPPYHYTRWTPEALKTVLERAGFEVLRVHHAPLPPGFFSGLLYYRLLLWTFPTLKKLLLGADHERSRRTWTSLLEARGNGRRPPRRLADPSFRQALVDAGLTLFRTLAWPLETPFLMLWRALNPDRGRMFYIAARRRQ